MATDLIRAAQFHHAAGVWIAALPPLSLYQPEGQAGHKALRERWLMILACAQLTLRLKIAFFIDSRVANQIRIEVCSTCTIRHFPIGTVDLHSA